VKWYIPSWNGDFRLEPEGDAQTLLSVHRTTAAEEELLRRFHEAFLKEGWITKKVKAFAVGMLGGQKSYVIDAPLEKVGPLVVAILKPGPAVLTAVRFEDGSVITCSGGKVELGKLAEGLSPYRENAAKPEKPAAEAAATVKRPTPCCPRCIPGAIKPASEVLLAFLDEEEHESWARDRCIVVEGGMSGHRYLLAHRHSEAAQRAGRICRDLDLDLVVHFHDWTVPPEEEVLAAKLILEHREPWLRNEATMLSAPVNALVYKNPFGNATDGVYDASITRQIGRLLGVPD
jgi:hypothetical protein